MVVCVSIHDTHVVDTVGPLLPEVLEEKDLLLSPILHCEWCWFLYSVWPSLIKLFQDLLTLHGVACMGKGLMHTCKGVKTLLVRLETPPHISVWRVTKRSYFCCWVCRQWIPPPRICHSRSGYLGDLLHSGRAGRSSNNATQYLHRWLWIYWWMPRCRFTSCTTGIKLAVVLVVPLPSLMTICCLWSYGSLSPPVYTFEFAHSLRNGTISSTGEWQPGVLWPYMRHYNTPGWKELVPESPRLTAW